MLSGVSKLAAQKIDRERFSLKKGDVKERYHITIRNKFATVENLEDNGDINRAWDSISENNKISAQESPGYCESKQHKPWFDEECSKLVDRRKQDKPQLLQNLCEVNENNLCNVWLEATRHFRNKKREYLKDNIDCLD
jgi:hypothetical protein